MLQTSNTGAERGFAPMLLCFMLVQISELLLGPTPPGFIFTPKHNSNSYSAASALGNANGQGAAAAPDMDDQAEG